MKRLFKIKTMASVLVLTILFVNVFSMNTFAMTSQELPENFRELSFEERFAWVEENIEGEYVQGEIVSSPDSNARASISQGDRTVYSARRASGIKQAGVFVYGFHVAYSWSVVTSNPISTIQVQSAKVVDEVKNFAAAIRYDGPTVSKSVNTTIGIGQCEVHTGILATTGYYDLFQYATLYYNGDTYFREVGGVTM